MASKVLHDPATPRLLWPHLRLSPCSQLQQHWPLLFFKHGGQTFLQTSNFYFMMFFSHLSLYGLLPLRKGSNVTFLVKSFLTIWHSLTHLLCFTLPPSDRARKLVSASVIPLAFFCPPMLQVHHLFFSPSPLKWLLSSFELTSFHKSSSNSVNLSLVKKQPGK